MLTLHHISYLHPDQELLFDQLSLIVNRHDKLALVGNNGSGKSTLLKIISGELPPSDGQLYVEPDLYYVPQIFGQYNHLTIAQALKIDDKLDALNKILHGDVTENHLIRLQDDWTIEERCSKAFHYWQLQELSLTQKMGTLSGGQKTKVFLAGISIHQPKFILLDEPSNHLDNAGRQLLYNFIRSTTSALIIVSHDRKLLNLLDKVCELSKHGLVVYGGNYDFYANQKRIENESLYQDLKNKEKTLRKAKEKEREILERKQKLDTRGKRKQEKAGVPTISLNTLRNNAERSTAKIKDTHIEKISGISQEMKTLRSNLPDLGKMKFDLNDSSLHNGKNIFNALEINFSYENQQLWKEHLTIQITSGERIALKGANGSGKTTLIKLLLGRLVPQTGAISCTENKAIYIDQDYSLIQDQYKVFEQALQFNTASLQEHEIKIRLNRFLFSKDDWEKPCHALSGGEKMRLMLCCLTMSLQSPDLIILDEPTNNLDLQNIEILTAAINAYEGTLIVVSHDELFLEQINIERSINL